MAKLRKLIIDGQEAEVDEFVPGDNIAFVTQPNGSIKINAAGGSESPYAAGEGIQISQENVISTDVRRPMISDAEESPALEPHAVGEYIIHNNVLYRVKTAIAVNDALVVDNPPTVSGNVVATNIGHELCSINHDLVKMRYADITVDSVVIGANSVADITIDGSPINYTHVGVPMGSIKGVVFVWSTWHVCSAVQSYASGDRNSINLSIWNMSGSSVTVTGVTLLVFYEG